MTVKPNDIVKVTDGSLAEVEAWGWPSGTPGSSVGWSAAT